MIRRAGFWLISLAIVIFCVGCGGPKLTLEEQLSVDILSTFKDCLKSPDSLQVHSISYVVIDGEYLFCIDYTAENGYGGPTRDELYVKTQGKEILPYEVTDDDAQQGAKVGYTAAQLSFLAKALGIDTPSAPFAIETESEMPVNVDTVINALK